ncbi:allantoinase AllB [Deinococcus gobiensis]|uniref:allantoinase AllB n=1 Tax=Deinococcus gobiensis TaxID=502394 RepID=UPI0002D37204|nr:allantoinase AllB [Deinococcus gobiensis]
MLDLKIEGARVALPGGLQEAVVGVEGGQIVAVEAQLGAAKRTVDARGLLLLPGVVDPHVHFSEPGRGHWEGWAHGSRAAAAGGVTTVVEMPLNAIPATVDVDALRLKVAAASAGSRVDYALWGGLMDDNRAELPGLHAAGVCGFKAFMLEIDDGSFRHAPDHVLYSGMGTLAGLGARLAVHAENSALIHGLSRDLRARGRHDPAAWLEAHPPVSELEAVQRALLFARDTGCALHLVHLSLPESLAAAAAARAAGQDVTTEVCAHHLTLTDGDFLRLGAVAKCAPPLRDPGRVEGLWAAVQAGTVDCLASDHSPAPMADKAGDDIWRAWGGINGLQLTLPLLLDEGTRRGVDVARLSRLLSGNPARLAGLGDRKGRVAPGFDADLVLVRPDAPWTLRADHLHSRHPWSPFLGRRFSHRVETVWRRGERLVEGGNLLPGVAGGLWQRPGQPAGTPIA